MIILQVGNNGLGNQLYTFALGIVLEIIYGKENVSYDVSQFTKYVRGRRMYDIRQIAGIQYREASIGEIRQATGMYSYKSPLFFTKRYKDDEAMIAYMQVHWKKRRINESSILLEENDWDVSTNTLEYIKDIIDADPNACYIYLQGYWQNIHYFMGYEREIISRIHFECKSDRCQRFLKMIKRTKSVSVHFRRGDFFKQNFNTRFCVCHRDYYIRAFDFVNSLETDVHYYFFSDDLPYVKKTFSYLKNVTFVEGLRDYEDLYLMTQCNMNIICNSTFSFWGGFLNCHEDAVVISPRIKYLKKRNGRWKSFLMSVPNNWIIL